jgi:hypothetical protein
MRRGIPTVVVATGVVALTIAGVWLILRPPVAEPSSLVVGIYRPTDEITLANLTIVDGAYRLSYSAEVQYFGATRTATMYCGLVDTSGRIQYLGRSVTAMRGTGAWRTIEFSGTFELPALTLGLQCSPASPGSLALAYREVAISAVPLAR